MVVLKEPHFRGAVTQAVAVPRHFGCIEKCLINVKIF
jgi:hypothetical protein